MACSPLLTLLALCSSTPQAPSAALALAEERPAVACMSKEAARRKYKGSHLYWHTARHCWDNHPTGGHYYAPEPPSATRAQRQPTDANANPAQPEPPEQPRPEIYYPSLMREQATIASDLFAVQRPITQWPLMLDIDITGPDPDHGVDGCCWPPLEDLR